LNKQISIVGCGWLGFPLAKTLIKKGFKIKGTTTTKDKLQLLLKEQIDAYYLKTTSEGFIGNVQESFSNSDVLILNIPPGLRKNPDQNYFAQIKNLIPYIEFSTIKKVLFISSTSVYADEATIPKISEKTMPDPDSESGKQLLQVEELLQKNSNFKTTILRFSGLIGEDRHPAKQLSGKIHLKNPKAPVNLIHLNDCIGIIVKIIEMDIFGETFNASTSPHHSKQSYYTSICKSMGLPIPSYDLDQKSKGKIILSQKLELQLNYKFQINL
jgi:nucleoside-diphosphate-sugar epimerase